ncbi:MAG: two-component regulator propeller domain-containing protein [Acidobacteriota bacterium]|nr:two-component regulator propeller domain-containing protein [Acidobacteriota bacterium]
MKNRAGLAVLGYLIFIVNLSLPSGASELHLERLGHDDGLSQAVVTSILKDSAGYLWFGTQEGLNRYDGRRFLVFRNRPGDDTSISINFIQTLFEDSQGQIWIGGRYGFLDRFNARNHTFSHFLTASSQGYREIRAIGEDHRGNIWVGTRGDGLICLSPATGETRNWEADQPEGPQADVIHSLTADREGFIWMGTDRAGLVRYDPEAEEFQTVGLGLSPDQEYLGKDALALLEDPDRREILWVGCYGGGLFRLDRRDLSATRYPLGADGLQNGMVVSLAKMDRTLWVGTLGGLAALDTTTGRFTHYRHRETNPNSLPDDMVLALLAGREGLWVGTYGGIGYHNPLVRRFEKLQDSEEGPRALQGAYSVLETQDESLWLGTMSDGAFRYLPKQKRLEARPLHAEPRFNKNMLVHDLHQDRDGAIWIGTSHGLERRDTNGAIQSVFHKEDGLPDNGVQALADHPMTDSLLAGTYQGLGVLNRKTLQVTGIAKDVYISGMVVDADGGIWAAGLGDGLHYLPSPQGPFKPASFNRPELNQTRTALLNIVQADDHLWLGTDRGLLLYEKNVGVKRIYGNQEGLRSTTVYALALDDADRLWIATNDGLHRLDAKDAPINRFTDRDGLAGNEFHLGGFSRGKNGRFYFAGDSGITSFFPKDFTAEAYDPTVVINGFVLHNEAVLPKDRQPDSPLETVIEQTDSLELKYHMNSFRFHYAALHVADPMSARFAYRLDPFQDSWNTNDPGVSTAAYTNLDPGRYRFRVRAAGKEGAWGEREASLEVVIRPPPWQMPYAYMFYTLIVSMSILGIFMRARRKRAAQLALSKELQRQVAEQTTDLTERNRELENLNAIVETINREMTLDKLLPAILEQGLQLFPQAEHGRMMIWDDRIGAYRMIAHSGFQIESPESVTYDPSESNIFNHERLKVISDGIVIYHPDPDKPYLMKNHGLERPICLLSMSMLTEGPHRGWVTFDNFNDPNAFSEDDGTKLARFRRHVINAFIKMDLLEKLRGKNDEILHRQNQLVMQEKMASLGVLTAGVAHEIRNPLNFIANFTELSLELAADMRRLFAGEEPREHDLDMEELLESMEDNTRKVYEHAMRAAQVVRAMMDLAPTSDRVRAHTKINDTVIEITDLTCRGLMSLETFERIAVEKEVDDSITALPIEPHGLRRALVNLVSNALEAVSARMAQAGSDYRPVVRVSTHRFHNSIKIEVWDNGGGVPEKIRKDIFHPFFTTKPPGSGHIGLGLSAAFDAVARYDGSLELECQDGNCSSFTISLPVKTAGAKLQRV